MLKTLLKEVKEYKKASILTPVMMLLEVVFETLIPLLMGMIVDISGDGHIDMKRVLLLGGAMLVLAAGGLWSGIMGGKYGAEASTGFGKNLRKTMFESIQGF